MKRVTKLIWVGGLTAFLLTTIVGIGVWGIARSEQQNTPASAETAIPVSISTVPDSTNTADQTSAHRQRVIELQTAIQSRQAEYQTEIQKANEQLTVLATAVAQREENLTALNTQLQDLQTALAERQLTYQTQLSQTQTALAERQSQLELQIQEAQSALATANAQLGR